MAVRGDRAGDKATLELPQERPRVLVIDDDPDFALALAETVSELGWDSDSCTETTQAMVRVREAGLAGLFIDFLMPGTNGLDILRESLSFHPGRPVVFMSGHDPGADVIVDALCRGPVMFIQKPMRRDEIHLALEMFRGLLPTGIPEAQAEPANSARLRRPRKRADRS